MGWHHDPSFIHHQSGTIRSSLIREIIFGMEDGMVSTMGAITGIAAGSRDHFIVVLSGVVIISVESISMAVGSYLSSRSERHIEERKLYEERLELKHYPEEEKQELVGMYISDGWPKKLAKEMAEAASLNKKLFLQEMAYRELKIIPENFEEPLHNAVGMGISYIVGGLIPLLPYFFITGVEHGLFYSIGCALIGLFVLGAYTAKFSKRRWWLAGLEMFALASLATAIGYAVGQTIEHFIR